MYVYVSDSAAAAAGARVVLLLRASGADLQSVCFLFASADAACAGVYAGGCARKLLGDLSATASSPMHL